jgi:polar amino acid transport system ATP-binding protein
MIRVESLWKDFGQLSVLQDICTEFRRGEVVVILGPSGSGKSTLLRCLNLLETPSRGRIYFGNQEITSPQAPLTQVRQRLAMVFQQFNLFPHMTALDNVTYAPIKVRGLSRVEAREQGRALVDRVGLADKAAVYPAQLSGGQKQRVAIARTLAMEPDMILFDEPTSSLDPEMVTEVLDVMRELVSAGMTMAIVTHEIGFARQVADRVLFLDQGRILEDSPPQQFFQQPQCDRARVFLRKMLHP